MDMERNTYTVEGNNVKISTSGGIVEGKKDDNYIKWLMGWIDGKGWSGKTVLEKAWGYAKDKKPEGCSWYAYGLLMAREQIRGRKLTAARQAATAAKQAG